MNHNRRLMRNPRHMAIDESEVLVRKIVVKVFMPNGKKKVVRQTAPPRKGFTSEQIDAKLESFSTHVEEMFPGETFRLVTLGKGQFNIIHVKADAKGAE